jgi:hypothetical protein
MIGRQGDTLKDILLSVQDVEDRKDYVSKLARYLSRTTPVHWIIIQDFICVILTAIQLGFMNWYSGYSLSSASGSGTTAFYRVGTSCAMDYAGKYTVDVFSI